MINRQLATLILRGAGTVALVGSVPGGNATIAGTIRPLDTTKLELSAGSFVTLGSAVTINNLGGTPGKVDRFLLIDLFRRCVIDTC